MVLLTRTLLWIFWLGLGVGSFVCFLSGLVGSSLTPFGSLLFTSRVLFGTSWFFFSIYCFLLIYIYIYIYIYILIGKEQYIDKKKSI